MRGSRWLRSCCCDDASDCDQRVNREAGTQTGDAQPFPPLWDEAAGDSSLSAPGIEVDVLRREDQEERSPCDLGSRNHGSDEGASTSSSPLIMHRIETVIDEVITGRQTAKAVRMELAIVDGKLHELIQMQDHLKRHLESLESMHKAAADEMSTLSATAALMICESDEDFGAQHDEEACSYRGVDSPESSPVTPSIADSADADYADVGGVDEASPGIATAASRDENMEASSGGDDDDVVTPPSRVSTSFLNPFSASVPQTSQRGSDFLDALSNACQVSNIASNFVSPTTVASLSPGRRR